MLKKTTKNEAHDTAGAPMPRPFIEGRETDEVRRAELMKAAPTIAQVRAETAALVAEAERVAQEALANLAQREHDCEVLRSLLIDERRAVSIANHWRGRPAGIAGEIAELEARLADVAVRFQDLDAPHHWNQLAGRLAFLREDAAQTARVLPIVEAALDAIRSKRAALQVALGFAVQGIGPDGRLEGEPPEPEPVRLEWQSETPGGPQRLRPVEVA